MRALFVGSLLFAALLPEAAHAESCWDTLRPPGGDSVTLTLVAVSSTGDISYRTGLLAYSPDEVLPNGVRREALWHSPILEELYAGPPPPPDRPALVRRLRSLLEPFWISIRPLWRHVALGRDRYSSPTFVGSCTSNGLIQGSVAGTDYLIYLSRTPPLPPNLGRRPNGSD